MQVDFELVERIFVLGDWVANRSEFEQLFRQDKWDEIWGGKYLCLEGEFECMSESYSVGNIVRSGGVEIGVDCGVCSDVFDTGDAVVSGRGDDEFSWVCHRSCVSGDLDGRYCGVVVLASRVDGVVVPREFAREAQVPIGGDMPSVEDVVFVVRE